MSCWETTMANRVDREKRDQRLRRLGLNGRLPEALTERVVEAVRTHPTGERYMLADGRVAGLALAVYPDGAANYVLQIRTQAGVARRCGLGSATSVTLEAARQVKDGTLLRHWNPLRALLVHAVDHGHLAALPMAGRPEPLRGLHDEPRVRWLGENDTEEELAKGTGERGRFFKALDKFESNEAGGGAFLQCVVRLSVNSGLRRGELLRLRDEMIKRGPDRIELPGAITKSGKARKVFLNPDALAAITRWLEVRKTVKVENINGAQVPGAGQR